MSAGAVEGPVSELAPEFTRATGHEVELHFNTVGAHKERLWPSSVLRDLLRDSSPPILVAQ